jgi:hypothetical protein
MVGRISTMGRKVMTGIHVSEKVVTKGFIVHATSIASTTVLCCTRTGVPQSIGRLARTYNGID